jgi:accessory colonization factor AcfC
MRKPLIVVAALFLVACDGNNNSATSPDTAKTVKDSSMAMQPIKSPYPVTYSSSFTMDDPKYAEAVLTLWKSYDSGNIASTKDLIADSIELYPSDGSSMKLSRDSAVALVTKQRSMEKSPKARVDAVMSVKSDKGEHWGLVWGADQYVDSKGNNVTVNLQETWRFNAAGKADLLYQFAQEQPKKKK